MADVHRFLTQAVDLALRNVVERRGRPFGAVLVKDGDALSTGVNEVLATGDPSAHAEMQAIRSACRRLGLVRLDGAVMVASGHPCPMCLAAMYLVGIREVLCALSLADAEPYGLSTADIYADLARPPNDRLVQVKHSPLPLEGRHPYEAWQKR